MSMVDAASDIIKPITNALESLSGSAGLGIRLWVDWVFWKSAQTKIANWDSTLFFVRGFLPGAAAAARPGRLPWHDGGTQHAGVAGDWPGDAFRCRDAACVQHRLGVVIARTAARRWAESPTVGIDAAGNLVPRPGQVVDRSFNQTTILLTAAAALSPIRSYARWTTPLHPPALAAVLPYRHSAR